MMSVSGIVWNKKINNRGTKIFGMKKERCERERERERERESSGLYHRLSPSFDLVTLHQYSSPSFADTFQTDFIIEHTVNRV